MLFLRFEEASLDIFIITIPGMSGAAADTLYRIQAPCYVSKLNWWYNPRSFKSIFDEFRLIFDFLRVRKIRTESLRRISPECRSAVSRFTAWYPPQYTHPNHYPVMFFMKLMKRIQFRPSSHFALWIPVVQAQIFDQPLHLAGGSEVQNRVRGAVVSWNRRNKSNTGPRIPDITFVDG